ncbi:MAG: preprotein translocase subunit SecG [Candidatus Niyogibacteria bacterium RIFCSPLOWO2_01_FULL_45_48]|uniref:Protein-export membrane protein SecG n=3 Tax=Parcubacteria group TaxID=1794811 RepID=A0A1G2EX43_9BACT|nr:MAG: preprotein translocase subunit SecG [Candidatus Niyogibacteria bacterium RIFCSPHIGHO2_01_FULL_45_28]OGZ30375.1 MAG: preprotein translocase subunit SecG [Candidatus Niyogibacteria bacterium RIFCSPLOWO2_02_FULL_45_13]OGZ30407.1 MAG: preprotein translocase subunit SecG [Candidatus Niyogibacteria bacterium RIFCSPLOWO2_01_FULL_45_48]OHA68027.1 MAG: preprotein translocase subunit SecG [Candidatus Wildermuthbacteria bacterium RIFCSPHIGHO2_02_FULL_47_17]
MKTLLPYAQIAVALLLIGSVLLQQKGTGLGAAFGGEGNIYRTKRGFEKVIFASTIVLGVVFLILAILSLF